MDNGSGPEIPFIVTEDLSSNPAVRVDDDAEFVFPTLPTSSADHSKNNSDPLLLSPGIPRSGRWSFDTSADEDERRPNPPPSPTLSTQSSVQSMTSAILRNNRPGDRTSSLASLNPTAEEGEDENGDGETSMATKLTRNGHVDPTPFVFRPFYLASLVDPKNLDALETMGGVTGLLRGVGVDAANGLSIGERPSKSSDAPTVVVTDPSGEKVVEDPPYEGAAFGAGVEDRQRVYGPNVLPVRKSRTLLELMWLALKDKVLVSPIHCSLLLP